MSKIKKNNSYQVLIDPQEEEIAHWVESDECLGSKMVSEEGDVFEQIKY